MKVIVLKDYNEICKKAAQLFAEHIKNTKNPVLGLATGSTPIGVYQELIRKYQKGEIDFSGVITFNLDEYYGLSSSHSQSYHYFMRNTFFKYINIKEENIHLLKGNSENITKECKQYEELIKKSGGIDLQILGIGRNGHIGFNEPDVSLNTKTHLVNLSNETIRENSRFFANIDDVPKQAITMGIGTIMRAKKIVLLASGRKKAHIIERTINGKVSTRIPSTVLKLHNDVIIILDKEAAFELEKI